MNKNPLCRFLLLGLALPTGGFWYAFFYRIFRAPAGEQADSLTAVLLVSSLLLTICLSVLYEGIFAQLDELEEIIQRWGDAVPMDMKRYFKRLHGPAGNLGTAFCTQMERTNGMFATLREETRQEMERTVKRELTEEIRRAILPDRQLAFPSHDNFAVAAQVREGVQGNCVFYDRFAIDPGLTCVVVGEASGEDVADAIAMITAQTTLRTRLRMGRPLVDAVAEVNTQMFDYGSHSTVGLLVGVLDILSGKMSILNAGGCPALLMRRGQGYAWLDIPLSAPLGQNQRVTYRAADLRLRQGDRVLFHTAGLGSQADGEGVLFRERNLLAELNRGSEKTPEESLTILGDAAEAFCGKERNGFAVLLVEYRKGDRELILCRVPAATEGIPPMLDFLKAQFAKAGIPRNTYARLIVMAEELFSLCVRKAERGSEMTVECGVAPDGESVNIRMTGQFHGVHPLSVDRLDKPSAAAAAFIEKQSDFIQFKSQGDQDMVTMVCFLSFA